MSDPAKPDAEGQPQLNINAQYIKDLSFEIPNAPEIFRENAQAEIPINIDVRARGLGPDVYEVELHFRVESKVGDKVAFILELVYGCVATLNLPEQHVQVALLVECPRLMFPFVRNIVANTTRDGGFAPLMIAPIDFFQLYSERMKAAQAEAAKPN